jgi:hypothetical protein
MANLKYLCWFLSLNGDAERKEQGAYENYNFEISERDYQIRVGEIGLNSFHRF